MQAGNGQSLTNVELRREYTSRERCRTFPIASTACWSGGRVQVELTTCHSHYRWYLAYLGIKRIEALSNSDMVTESYQPSSTTRCKYRTGLLPSRPSCLPPGVKCTELHCALLLTTCNGTTTVSMLSKDQHTGNRGSTPVKTMRKPHLASTIHEIVSGRPC